ncbi:MAG: YbaB/EbfC family nucleoid-associated protein [Chrysiogenetes bacterium]|nr:YbaB/EbfC family nucleoid-associated protein [Chrysiogenetes bacterium]
MSDESGIPGGLGNLFQQAQQMAQQLQEKQKKVEEELAGRTVEAASGGGMVTVTVTLSGKVRKVRIDKTVVDPEDVTMLEDLVQAALNAALRKAEEAANEERSKLGGGLGLPAGLNLGDLFK